MGGVSVRHQVVLEELTEWWEDLCTRVIGSRAVLVAVPPGWGRSTLIDQLTAIIERDNAPVTVTIRIDGKSLHGIPGGAQGRARVLADVLSGELKGQLAAGERARAGRGRRAAELAGVDRPAGAVQLGLGVGALFATPLAAAAAMVLGTVVVGAAGKVIDDSPAGPDGVVARAARSVAGVSAKVPVVVLADDIDILGRELALVLAENLLARPDGQVLLVAVTDLAPDGVGLRKELASQPWLTGRVQRVDADPDMGTQARVGLAAELCPGLPTAVIRRIAQRTTTFAQVFAICSAHRIVDAVKAADEAEAAAITDAVVDAAMSRQPVSMLAGIVAWAGGVLHARQAHAALAVLGEDGQDADPDPGVVRTGVLVRLADPASPGLSAASGTLSAVDWRQVASALTTIALEVGTDPSEGFVEQVVAAQAAYHVRGDLPDMSCLPAVACQLVAGLEVLGDLDGAYQVAKMALAETNPDQYESGYRQLAATVLRIAHILPAVHADPLVADLTTAAVAGGAAIGLEARLWAAIDLLGDPEQRETALSLVEQVAARLGIRQDLGDEAASWRRLLAFHAGKYGYPGLARQVLALEITAGSPHRQDAAQAVLYAIGGPHADTGLQIIGCRAELAATPDSASDDRLRLHHTLAYDYSVLGDYRRALEHATEELQLRYQLQGPDHPSTLSTRHNIAFLTSGCGDGATALRLFRELLPDQVRVLGSSHPNILTTRANIAASIGQCGDGATALRLFRELLPDRTRVLGPSHPDTLSIRSLIAAWTGRCDDSAAALRLSQELLPDQTRVLGPSHKATLSTRNSIAAWTSERGDVATALHLGQELLRDQVRVLGPDHPDTLSTRGNIAAWTGQCGDSTAALRLSQELLPDQTRVLGPDHPDTLLTRNNMATLTGQCGDSAGALRLSQELLPDHTRVLGPDHPRTLTTRHNIANWTSECGDMAEALRLLQELLPDRVRVLGPDHVDTLLTRRNIAFHTGACGDPAQALRLFQELLPDEARVLGPSHPDTLDTRRILQIAADQGKR